MDPTPPAESNTAPILDAAGTRILISAGLLIVTGDFLLWPATPHLSLGLFAVASCAAILLNRSTRRLGRSEAIGCLLLSATAIQTSIEVSFSNILVLLLLLAAILGEACFPSIRARWIRWMEGVWKLVRAPMVWLWAGPVLKQLIRKPAHAQRYGVVLVQVGLPTLVIVGIFAIVLSKGNAILARWIADAFSSGLDGIPTISPSRVLLWIVIATFALAILRPAVPILSEQAVTHSIPYLPEPRDLSIARLRTWVILVALNLLFFAVNTIDAFYLWIHQALPAGVNYSDFVHQGVNSLTLAVLLSAFVLTVVYQQSPQITGLKGVRILSLVWIGQNVVLIAGVLLRLNLYVHAYQLSEQRVYVVFFLLLVAVGFALLAWRIAASKSLQWLLLANGLAAFVLFFIVQFLDVARWVADYNVARWQENPGRVLDVEYLTSLGHSAYPALIRVAETPGRSESHGAFLHLQALKELERERLPERNWRSLQLREQRNAQILTDHKVRTRR